MPQVRWKRGAALVLAGMLIVAAAIVFENVFVGDEWHKLTATEKIVERVFFAVVWPMWLTACLAFCDDILPLAMLVGWVIAGLYWAAVFEGCAIVKRRISIFAALGLFIVILCTVNFGMTRNFHRVYCFSPTNACVNNLRRIDAAKQQWALENSQTSNAIPTWRDILPYLGRQGETNCIPKCPEGGQYILGKVGEDPRCSFGNGHSLSTPP